MAGTNSFLLHPTQTSAVEAYFGFLCFGSFFLLWHESRVFADVARETLLLFDAPKLRCTRFCYSSLDNKIAEDTILETVYNANTEKTTETKKNAQVVTTLKMHWILEILDMVQILYILCLRVLRILLEVLQMP